MRIFRKVWWKCKSYYESWSVNFKRNVFYQELNIPNKDERSEILCLFAHYSDDGTIHPYVIHYISTLKNSGCDVLFVSSSGKSMGDEQIQKLNGLVVGVLIRNNFGYDFGSWKTAVDSYPRMTGDYKNILFVNDSVYGPFSDLAPIIDSWLEADIDLWSLTDSEERCHHVQTYFWGLNSNAIEMGFFDFFWNEYYRFISDRDLVIKRYELMLGELAKSKFDLRVGACYRIETLMDFDPISKSKKINPMIHFARQLVMEKKFPFVKREYFNKDPLRVGGQDVLSTYLEIKDRKVWGLVGDHSLREKK